MEDPRPDVIEAPRLPRRADVADAPRRRFVSRRNGCRAAIAWVNSSYARSASRSRSSVRRRTSRSAAGRTSPTRCRSSGSSPTARSPNFLSQEYRVPSIDLTAVELDAELGKLVTRDVCEKHKVIPISRAGLVAHRRDERPDEPPRHRRHQVPHGLQRRAGGRERDGDPRGDREALRRGGAAAGGGSGGSARRPRLAHRRPRRRRRRVRQRRRGRREPRRAHEGQRGRPRGAPLQRDPPQRHQGARERHPHRALREDDAGALPRRRRAPRGAQAAAEDEERDLVAHQDHVEPRHRRATTAAGRAHQAQARRRQGDGLPRLGAPDDLGREDRACVCSTSRTCSST